MGRLTKRVKFLARERRLSIPTEFLNDQSLARGDHLWAGTHQGVLWIFSEQSWEQHRRTVGRLRRWYPGHEHPYLNMVSGGTRVRLGSQDRVVLPKEFPFRADETIRLHWESADGILRLEPEASLPPAMPLSASGPSQGSLLEFVGQAGERFNRDDTTRTFVEQVQIADIDTDDRRLAEHDPFPDEGLVSAIRVEGLRRPLLLHRRNDGRLQIVDGFRRVAAATHLRLTQAPAIVLAGLTDTTLRKIRVALDDAEPAAESPALNLMRSTLKLHEGQVALQEIEKITGRRKRTLQRYLRVAGNPVLRDCVERGQLSIFKAEEILKAGVDPEVAIRKRWTVQEIRNAGRRRKRRRGGRVAAEREG